MNRAVRIVVAMAMIATMFVSMGPTQQALSSPVATDEITYTALGRIFPDPQGCGAGAGPASPYAKGLVCATDFLQYGEMVDGMRFLEESFSRYVKFYTLHKDFKCNGKRVTNKEQACKGFRSAGLPVTVDSQNGEGFTRDRKGLRMVRITDERVSNKRKKFFVFPLSIHGIERAGVEGGARAAEDLATWAACQNGGAPEYVDCDHPDNDAPHPLLETTPKRSITAGKAMKKAAVFFIFPNPDGWMRGERTSGNAQFFQRYNGNGVDLNRDWPSQGFTYRPYTPWSEPETRAFGRVLRAIGPKDSKGKPKWTGGIDLHGQLVDRAFSFTLIGGSERPYGKNQRVMQTVKGAWADAEKRLAWSPLIKPNDASPDDPRVYGVQYGTIWDTIAYTVTGALGDWIDSPIGLNADGIDNEMSLSHLSNCGIGTCWDPDVEQLHVDGNKSLIYSMIHYSLKPEYNTFHTKGRVAYLHNRGVIKEKADPLKRPPRYARLKPQKDIKDKDLNVTNDFIHQFDVKGPKQGVYNGGISAQITCAPIGGVGTCALSEARLERRKPAEPNAQGERWETVNSYFNQSPAYVQAGQALHANLPIPGRYRVRIVNGEAGSAFKLDINFTREKGWPDPGQVGYKATSMKFWRMLKRFSQPEVKKLTARKISKRHFWKRRYDTIVVTNKVYRGLADELKAWVKKFDGNLVLTDKAIKMLKPMGIVGGGVKKRFGYAGYVNFASASKENTYKDPLARKINLPGAAEGQGGSEVHRRQTYEPVPLGIAIQNPDGGDSNNSPIWYVEQPEWKKAKGRERAVGTSGDTNNVSYGEIKLNGGRIRVLGAILPNPTKKFDHPFGLASYGVTYAGYQMLNNLLRWER